jgi:hypothetical protein
MRIYDYIVDASLASLIQTLFQRTQTRAFSGGTLAAKATSDPDLKTTTTINFAIDGKLYIKTAAATIDLSGVASAATNVAQAAGTYCAYLVVLNASGTFDVIKGTDASTAALALAATPAVPASSCPVGILVVANTTNAFTLGTTNSDATGVTWTCYDICDIPTGYGTSSVYKNALGA